MFRFCRCHGAGRLPVKIDAVFAFATFAQIGDMAGVEFQCAAYIGRRQFRQPRRDVEVNSEFERLPPWQIEPRKALRKLLSQD